LSPEFKRVAILGVGLIGGSLGMALCSRRLAGEVVGAGSSPENLQLAVELGAIHRYTASPADSVTGAEIVVIATPISATIPVLQEVLPYLDPGTVITDVGSTKAGIVLEAERAVGSSLSFVGGHPMAGSDLAGVRGADPYLFENAFYIITPTTSTPPQALAKVRRLAEGVGARVIEMEPERHDLAVAAVSHLPHLLAATLVNTVARLPGSEAMLPLAAGGFRDMTRIASSSAVMWRDIFATNKDQVIKVIRSFRSELDSFEDMVAAGDRGAIQDCLEQARMVRSTIPSRTKGYLPRLFEIVLTVPDRPGVIADFAGHLAEVGINICDLEILRVRDGEGGTIRVAFAAEEERDDALWVLREKGYTVRER
jgi:prephenate dehydrogenase